jgi:hypothetical protein
VAAEWIKVELHLPEKPEVLEIASLTNLHANTVVGALIKVWGWASRNCNADGVTTIAALAHIDQLAGHEGFAEGMIEAGWLRVKDTKITFTNFDRHCSQTAKDRALMGRRVKSHRCNANVTQKKRSNGYKNVTREDKNNNAHARPAEGGLGGAEQFRSCL